MLCAYTYINMNVKYAICRTDPRKVDPLTRTTVFHTCKGMGR